MLVLFDHGTPRGIARGLQGHTVKEARAQGWDTLSNGELLKAAEEAGFDVLLTTDTNLPYQRFLTCASLHETEDDGEFLDNARGIGHERKPPALAGVLHALREGGDCGLWCLLAGQHFFATK